MYRASLSPCPTRGALDLGLKTFKCFLTCHRHVFAVATSCSSDNIDRQAKRGMRAMKVKCTKEPIVAFVQQTRGLEEIPFQMQIFICQHGGQVAKSLWVSLYENVLS